MNQKLRQLLVSLEPAPAPVYLQRLLAKSGGKTLFLDVDEIDWIEAADYYVQIHIGGECHLLRERLSSLEERLDPNRFFRVHRSTLVNQTRIVEMEPSIG